MAEIVVVPVISNVRHDGEDLSIGDTIQVASTQLVKLNSECFAIDKAKTLDGKPFTIAVVTTTEETGGSGNSETKPRRGGRKKAADTATADSEEGDVA